MFEGTRPYQNGSWGDRFLPLIPANGGCRVKNSSKCPCIPMARIGLVLCVCVTCLGESSMCKEKKNVLTALCFAFCMTKYVVLDLSHMSHMGEQ